MEESSPGLMTTTDFSDSLLNPATSQGVVALGNGLPPTEAPQSLNSRKPNTPYFGFNPDLIGTPSTPPGTDRFIFVNAYESLTPGQRQRVDQKAINAHVQTTAFRQRRSAAVERLKRNAKANAGRSRPVLVPQSEAGGSYSQNSTLAAAISIRGVVLPRRGTNVGRRNGSMEHRISGHDNAMIPWADEDIDSEDEDDSDIELQAMRKVLESIRERMSALQASRMRQGSPQSLLDSGDVDPFAIASVPITKGMNKVFSHYLEVMIPSVFPIRSQVIAQNQWAMRLAFAQPLVLFSILAVAAAELQARLGQLRNGSVETAYTEKDLASRTVPDFVGYKLRAIKLANQKMANTQEAVGTPTIYALMCLLSIEVITGNKKEISLHVNGLQRIIAIRGGYQGLPPHVTENVLSTTYMCAAMTGSLPPAPPTSSIQILPTAFDLVLSDTPPFLEDVGTALLLPPVAALFDWQLNQAFHDLREVVLYREYYHHKECAPPAAELEYYNVKSYNLRYLVLTIPFQNQVPVSDKQEACRIALLIFWNANYLIGDPESALFRRMTIQLKAALETSDLRHFWDPHFELLVWVLFLGAHISAGQRERPWFAMNLARGARLLKLDNWADVRTILLRHFYIDRIYQKSFEEAWQEARMLVELFGA